MKLKFQLITAGSILLLGFVLVPKPQLIKYKSASIISEAIYWDGFGSSGMLSDANASFVKLDNQTSHLHICYGLGEEKSNCQEYKVLENRGFSGAIGHLLK